MKIRKVFVRTGVVLFSLVLLVLLVLGAIAGFTLSAPQAWHDAEIAAEAFDYDSYESFDDYLADEARFLTKLYSQLDAHSQASGKYKAGAQGSPIRASGENWNASFQWRPPTRQPVGGVLLVHGLSDSPYHMRAVARLFQRNGYYVIGLRLPGHGTAPGALIDVKWEDWDAAVKFGARMVEKEIAQVAGAPFLVGGFSTGGALTLKYTLDAVTSAKQRVPDRLFLFSPAIGVTRKAMLADWHQLVAWLPYYDKFRWESIEKEDDPFKYNSFAKNAGDQIFELTLLNKLKARLVAADDSKRAKMPPIYAFQSLVDATVSTGDVIGLFKRLGSRESELVLFDVNRSFEGTMKPEIGAVLAYDGLADPEFRSRLIIATNQAEPGEAGADGAVVFYRAVRQNPESPFALQAMARLPQLFWPENAFALSHVCLPIAPDDAFYGQRSGLGRIDARTGELWGERGVLAGETQAFNRIRYNPFFAIVENRVEAALTGPAGLSSK